MRKASPMPAAYSTRDARPFRSEPSAVATADWRPSARMMVRVSSVKANRGSEGHDPVRRRRPRGAVRGAHPLGDHRDQGQPEEQVQVGPHHAATDVAGGPQQMVMVVPVDPDEGEAEDVHQQRGEPVAEGRERRAVRGPED